MSRLNYQSLALLASIAVALAVDAVLIATGQPTLSESLWALGQQHNLIPLVGTLLLLLWARACREHWVVVLIAGIACGHLFWHW